MKCGRPSWPVRVQSRRRWPRPPRSFLSRLVLGGNLLFRVRLLRNVCRRHRDLRNRFRHHFRLFVVLQWVRFRLGIVVYHNHVADCGSGSCHCRFWRLMVQRQLDLFQFRDVTDHGFLLSDWIGSLQFVHFSDLWFDFFGGGSHWRNDRCGGHRWYRRGTRTSLVDFENYSRRVAARV